MHISFLGTMLRCGVLALLLISTTPVAWSQDKMTTSLFKIITVKDEIVIGLNADELDRLGGRDAGAVARALAAKGEMTVWQYGVRRGPTVTCSKHRRRRSDCWPTTRCGWSRTPRPTRLSRTSEGGQARESPSV